MKRYYCSACFSDTGIKKPIIGSAYTATYTYNGKSYSHVLCLNCAREAATSGIVVYPDLPIRKDK
jgi:hypothetical protein